MIEMIQSTLLFFSRLHQTGIELFLVRGLNVPLEVAGLAECFIAVRTSVRSHSKMNCVDMNLELVLPREFLRTKLATERPLLGVGPDVTL